MNEKKVEMCVFEWCHIFNINVNKPVLFVLIIFTLFTQNSFAIDAATIPKVSKTKFEEVDDAAGISAGNKDTVNEFSATPSVISDKDIVLTPSLQVSFEDVWLHWFVKDDGTKHKYWKHRFSSTISLNGAIDAKDNDDLIQKYMANGGNLNVDFKFGVSAGGATNDGFSTYLFGKYSYLDTKEFTSETETQELKLETALYGVGLGVKFQDRFYLGWEGGRATILGDEDTSGSFYRAIDDKIIQRVLVIWALDKTDTSEDSASYINFFRSWGAAADAEIGIEFSKTFDLDL